MYKVKRFSRSYMNNTDASSRYYSLGMKFHDAKRAYKDTLDYSEEMAEFYDDSVKRLKKRIKSKGYDNFPSSFIKRNPSYNKDQDKSIDKIMKEHGNKAKNLRRKPKIEAFKNAIDSFKSGYYYTGEMT